jgi:hypothetical protein
MNIDASSICERPICMHFASGERPICMHIVYVCVVSVLAHTHTDVHTYPALI